MASLAGFELGGIEMDLGELCQDRDWALNFFTQCEEVQMAAMSKDRQLAMSQVSIKYATFLFFLKWRDPDAATIASDEHCPVLRRMSGALTMSRLFPWPAYVEPLGVLNLELIGLMQCVVLAPQNFFLLHSVSGSQGMMVDARSPWETYGLQCWCNSCQLSLIVFVGGFLFSLG